MTASQPGTTGKQPDRCWVGFDLGGTKMMATVFDEDFRPLGRKRRKTKGADGARAGMDRVLESIHDALQEAGRSVESIRGVGIGCPGTVDLEKGQIIDSANLGWKNVHVKEILERELRAPAVVLNDVDAGVYGEYRFGAGKNARCLIGVFPGTGIGGGCVYDGVILRGKNLSAFEIGHVQVNPNGALCGCGRIGCLETEASRLAISAAAAMAAYRGEAPHLYQQAETDLGKIRSGVLAASVKAGDKAVERIIQRAARLIGQVVGDVVNLLAPEVVVLGGGLVEAMPDLFIDGVEKSARERAAPPYAKLFKVTVAKLGDDAVTRGTAGWAEHCFAAASSERAADQAK